MIGNVTTGMGGIYGGKINKDHLVGFAVGVGVAAAGYYLYVKNRDKVDSFLASYGVNVPKKDGENLTKLTLEELLLKKEALEDMIAEKELGLSSEIID